MKVSNTVLKIALLAFLLVDIASRAYAAPGDLDPAFNGGGLVRTGFGAGSDYGYASAMQPDGKLIVTGMSDSLRSFEVVVVRYNVDGSLDASFNGSGKLVTDLGTYGSKAFAVAVQPDGKIVVAGMITFDDATPYTTFYTDRVLILRFNPDGSPDLTFDRDGKVITRMGYYAAAFALAIQPDGKILATGTDSGRIFLARYQTNGALDLTFDGDGIVSDPFGGQGAGIAVQPDNKILLTGYASGSSDILTFRFNTDGSADTSFNGSGRSPVLPTPGTDRVYNVVVQEDGKVVVGGMWNSSPGVAGALALVRYNADGTCDGTFGDNGFLNTGLSGNYYGGLVQENNGKLLLSARGLDGVTGGFAAVRLHPDGSRDLSFNGTGSNTVQISGFDSPYAILTAPDGKVIVIGFIFEGFGNYDLAAVRYNNDGSVDDTFNADGKVSTDVSNVVATAVAIETQSDGKIVVAGTRGFAGATDNNQIALVRYNADGTLDPSFNGSGKVITWANTGGIAAEDMAIQSDGRIVVAATTARGSKKSFALLRYNIDGSLDASFGENGWVQTSIGKIADNASGLKIQADGKIVVCGTSRTTGTYSDFAVVRYNPDGSLDTGFDGDGKVTTTFDTFNTRYISGAAFVDIQSDGKLVVAGYTGPGGNIPYTLAAIVRYNSNGSPDWSFNRSGKKTFKIAPTDGNSYVSDLKIQADNRMVVTGNGAGGVGIARLNEDGSFDVTFNGTGRVLRAVEQPGSFVATTLLIQPDGKLVVGGRSELFYNSGASRSFSAFRFEQNGTLDTTWGNNGVSKILRYQYDTYTAMTIDKLGNILVAGADRKMFGIARFLGDNSQPIYFTNDSNVKDATGADEFRISK